MDESGLQIVEFEKEYSGYFASLNMAWLQQYFEVEDIDREILYNPESYILDKGGFIFFAKLNENIEGTFALIKVTESIYELSKMAVDSRFQGKKIGNKMLTFCMEKAQHLGIDKIILFSNTKLEPALHLYRKFGFKEVPLGHSEYRRANIKMEVNIKRS